VQSPEAHALDELFLVEHPHAALARLPMGGLDDGLGRLPDGPDDVAARSSHPRMGQAHVGVKRPATRARLRERPRIFAACRQLAVHDLIQRELRGQAVRRNAGDVAQQGVDLVGAAPGFLRPAEHDVEIAQHHVHLRAAEAEPRPAVHDPAPRARWMYLAVRGERGQIDAPTVVDADVPIAPIVGGSRRAGATEGHGLYAVDAAEHPAQLGDRPRQPAHSGRR